MYGGIFIGKCSKSSMHKVLTFCLKDATKEYYYCTVKHIRHSIGLLSTRHDAQGTHQAAPVILAFWSDEQ